MFPSQVLIALYAPNLSYIKCRKDLYPGVVMRWVIGPLDLSTIRAAALSLEAPGRTVSAQLRKAVSPPTRLLS